MFAEGAPTACKRSSGATTRTTSCAGDQEDDSSRPVVDERVMITASGAPVASAARARAARACAAKDVSKLGSSMESGNVG